MTTPDTPPAVPPKVRTIAYYTAAVCGVLGTATINVIAVTAPAHAQVVAAVVGAIVGAVAGIAGILGAIYRPTVGAAK